MVPPPPGRFSRTKLWPICFDTWSRTMRAMVSPALPAETALMVLIGRLGHVSAATA